MHYRSILDLNQIIVRSARLIPRDLDIVVGIPRSGMLAANLLALHLNLPFSDVDGFLAGRVLSAGSRIRSSSRFRPHKEIRSALILDDSISSGQAMREVRAKVESARLPFKVYYAAVYATHESAKTVDFVYNICPHPRIFEWNMMHHPNLSMACVDIDGVLCRDPTVDENDDGLRYRDFLESTEPHIVPTVLIGQLVTCRLEKYRSLTADWLRRHNVEYRELIMMQYATKEERLQAGSHARFKANVYRASTNCLFIDSSLRQALEISRLSGKAVFCTESREMIKPPALRQAFQAAREKKWWLEHKSRELVQRLLGKSK